uniref:Sugar transporter SWEET n=1 Tax=Parascaris univalens TaxID=6257 RepID=A0A915BYQ7_PARUN
YTANTVWSVFLTSTAVHAILLIASPVQAVCKWYRRQSSDGDTALPYVCACIGSSLWLRYSMFINDLKLILLQTYAVTMQLFFIVALLFYRSKKRHITRGLLSIVLMLLALFIYAEGLAHEDGKKLIGRFASGSQIAGSLVCPYLIHRAFKTKVIDFVPFAPVAFTWIMEMHAIIYSIAIDDFYMLLANTTFFLMDGSLLAMFFVYPTERKTEPKLRSIRVF